MEQRKCQLYPKLNADRYIKCGFYEEYKKGTPHNEYYLSDKAAKELWEKNKNIVNAGLYHWFTRDLTEAEKWI